MTGRGSSRSRAASAFRRRPARLPSAQRMTMPQLGSESTGSAPLPIWLNMGSTVTVQAGASAAWMSGSRRSAWRRMSACGRMKSRSVVSRSGRRSGTMYRRSSASIAARVILPTRSARLSGFFLMRAMRSR